MPPNIHSISSDVVILRQITTQSSVIMHSQASILPVQSSGIMPSQISTLSALQLPGNMPSQIAVLPAHLLSRHHLFFSVSLSLFPLTLNMQYKCLLRMPPVISKEANW